VECWRGKLAGCFGLAANSGDLQPASLSLKASAETARSITSSSSSSSVTWTLFVANLSRDGTVG
jgi:hypothetical protein